MIGRIGNTAITSAQPRVAARAEVAQVGRTKNPYEAAKRGEVPRPDPERQYRAGFGERTLSTIGAAMDTLDTTIQRSKRIVPTIDQAMEAARKKQQEGAASTERPQATSVAETDTVNITQAAPVVGEKVVKSVSGASPSSEATPVAPTAEAQKPVAPARLDVYV